MNIKKILTGTGLGLLIFGFTAMSVYAANYFNDFEVDTSGWFDDGVEISRVSSGTNGITSADGSYHAEVIGGAFTRWGGYESTFPTDGYITQIDIYLNMEENSIEDTDKRFDFSSAINDPSGVHRRDFIFSVGTDPLVPGQFAMSASNNSPGWPSNPGRDPYFVNESGWYTFRHTFLNNGGILEVKMDVLNESGTVLKTWILSDPTDEIGVTVGGNRYGWFVDSDFNFLAVDNSKKIDIVPFDRTAEITSPLENEQVFGVVNFDAILNDEDKDDSVQWAVRKGTCAAGTNTVFGNVDGFNDPFTWDYETFHASADTSAWDEGEYCFVFNPTESDGDTPIRLTREFNVGPLNDFEVPEQCAQDVVYNLIEGTDGADKLNGTNGSDLIYGYGGADKINGNGGNDCLVGGAGADRIHGNNGNDVILGDAGADSLYGDNGSDTIYGGADADFLRGGNQNDFLYGDLSDEAWDVARGDNGIDTCEAETERRCEL